MNLFSKLSSVAKFWPTFLSSSILGSQKHFREGLVRFGVPRSEGVRLSCATLSDYKILEALEVICFAGAYNNSRGDNVYSLSLILIFL